MSLIALLEEKLNAVIVLNEKRERDTTKNLHISHVEDLVLEDENGAKIAVDILKKALANLTGEGEDGRLSVKLDGRPSLFFGKDPEDNKFFVGTKSIFNKKTPRVIKTDKDVDENYSDKPDLARKMKIALKELSKLRLTSVFQADLMYVKEDIKENKNKLFFKPNTVIYSIGKETELGKKIAESEIGLALHTKYTGDSISELKAAPASAKDIKSTKNIVFFDVDSMLSAERDDEEEKAVRSDIKKLDALSKGDLSLDDDVCEKIMSFNNQLIKQGKLFPDNYVDLFVKHLNAEKMERAREAKSNEKAYEIKKEHDELISSVKKKKSTIEKIQDVRELTTKIKKKILSMADIKGLETETDHEGLVMTDGDTTVKLVDRLVFAKDNFENNDKKPT